MNEKSSAKERDDLPDSFHKCGNNLLGAEKIGQVGIPAITPRSFINGHAILPFAIQLLACK